MCSSKIINIGRIVFFGHLLFLTTLVYHVILVTPVRILVPCYNRPKFIEIQNKLFGKFLLDDFQLIIFNDAESFDIKEQIKRVCLECGIQHVDVPQTVHRERQNAEMITGRASYRHAEVIQFAMKGYGFGYDGILVLFDNDLFLIKSLSFSKLLGGNHIVGYKRIPNEMSGDLVSYRFSHMPYLWPGLVILNMPKLPDQYTLSFDPVLIGEGSLITRTDTGGAVYNYLKAHENLKIKWLPRFEERQESVVTLDQNEREVPPRFVELLKPVFPFFGTVANYFWHYGMGSDYMNLGPNFHEQKERLFFDYVEWLLGKKKCCN